jgi:cytochrome c peroxidase
MSCAFSSPSSSSTPYISTISYFALLYSKSTIQHMRDIFSRMGLTDQEMVALLGAHAMGRCYTDRSGYWGPWTNAETTFSNEYFRLLVEERWSPKVTHNGKPWTGPDQFEDSTGTLMMLPVDIALLAEPAFHKHVLKYAKDEEAFFKVRAV